MQHFLSRASPSCRFSSTSISCSHRITGPVAICPLKRKFGEFYKRFYSAASGAVAPGKYGGEHHYLPTKSGGQPAEVTETLTEVRRRRRTTLGLALLDEENLNANIEQGSSHWSHTRSPPHKRRVHPSQRFFSKERHLLIEKSTRDLTSRFLEHDHLVRELRAEIKCRQTERRRASSRNNNPETSLQKSLLEEVELLKRTLRYISTHYYEPPTSVADPEAQYDPSANLKTSSVPWFKPYLPPFPNYTSDRSGVLLNRSLVRLLRTRPPPPALVPRICYNLLTSPSPPNVHTYNILIEGLTHVRNGSLAHLVFRNMAEGGLGPKGNPNEETIVRMANLCVKTADREGFDRIVKITNRRNMAGWWGFGKYRVAKTREQKARSKIVLEAFIHGAARFGDIQQVRVWLRAMTRECPNSPKPSTKLYTSLMHLWTEKKDWDRGLQCWRGLMKLDMDWLCDRGGNPADIRAFHQMLKLCQVCGKNEMHQNVLAKAIKRGFKENMVLASISKEKGLWIRRENKVPHIRGQRNIGANKGEGILISLEKAWDMQDLGHLEGTKDISMRRRRQHRRRRSFVSDAARSRIWDDVISRRMDNTRPDSASGGEVRRDLAERRRQQKQMRTSERELGVRKGKTRVKEARMEVVQTKTGVIEGETGKERTEGTKTRKPSGWRREEKILEEKEEKARAKEGTVETKRRELEGWGGKPGVKEGREGGKKGTAEANERKLEVKRNTEIKKGTTGNKAKKTKGRKWGGKKWEVKEEKARAKVGTAETKERNLEGGEAKPGATGGKKEIQKGTVEANGRKPEANRGKTGAQKGTAGTKASSSDGEKRKWDRKKGNMGARKGTAETKGRKPEEKGKLERKGKLEVKKGETEVPKGKKDTGDRRKHKP